MSPFVRLFWIIKVHPSYTGLPRESAGEARPDAGKAQPVRVSGTGRPGLPLLIHRAEHREGSKAGKDNLSFTSRGLKTTVPRKPPQTADHRDATQTDTREVVVPGCCLSWSMGDLQNGGRGTNCGHLTGTVSILYVYMWVRGCMFASMRVCMRACVCARALEQATDHIWRLCEPTFLS